MQEPLKKLNSAVLILICLVFLAAVKLILNSFATNTANDSGRPETKFQNTIHTEDDYEKNIYGTDRSKNSLFILNEINRAESIKSEAEDLGTKLFKLNENSEKKTTKSRNEESSNEITKEIFWTIF